MASHSTSSEDWRNLYTGGTVFIKGQGTECDSENFDIMHGVRQGDPMSTTLWTTLLASTMKRWKRMMADEGIEAGVEIANTKWNHVVYADDVIIIGLSPEKMSKMLQCLRTCLQEVGLDIDVKEGDNTEKAAAIRNGTQDDLDDEENGEATEDEGQLEKIDACGGAFISYTPSMEWLGCSLDSRKKRKRVCLSSNTTLRISRARIAWCRYKQVLPNTNIELKQRIRLFEACETTRIAYACGGWVWNRIDLAAVRKLENNCWRAMLSLNWYADREEWYEDLQNAQRVIEAGSGLARNAGNCWDGLLARNAGNCQDRLFS